jgi:hypothetical protein
LARTFATAVAAPPSRIIAEPVSAWRIVMRRVSRCCLVLGIAAIGGLAGGASASGSASNAPQTSEYSSCTEFSPDFTFCEGMTFFLHQALTPSGNVALQLRIVQWQSTRLGDGTSIDWQAKSRATQLVRSEELQQVTSWGTNDTTYRFPDGTISECTYHVFLHQSNGEYRFNRVEFECPT